MNRTSLAARFSFAALLGATLLLAACSDDGDGGDAAGGSATDSPLSGLLSGFGTPGAGNTARPASDAGATSGGGGGGGGAMGAGGAEVALDAGVVEPVMPDTPVSENCSRICERIAECMPEGCPNFGRLPEIVQNQTIADCEAKCGDVTDEYADAVRRLSCEQVTAELLMDADVSAFCALVPASETDCRRFCRQLQACGVDVTDEQCDTACLYNVAGVECIIERGCEAGACAQHFEEPN
jgi:hypothetical protein